MENFMVITASCFTLSNFEIQDPNDIFVELFNPRTNTSFVSIIVSEVEREEIHKNLIDVLSTKKELQFECRCFGYDRGEPTILRVNWKAKPFENGILLNGTLSQNSLYNLLNEQEYSDFVHHLPALIHCVDYKGNIQWTNLTGSSLFGYEKEELIGKNINQFVFASSDEITFENLQNLDSIEYRAMFLMKNGEFKPIQVCYCAYYSDSIKFFAGCITEEMTDIVEEKKEREKYLCQQAELNVLNEIKFVARFRRDVNAPLIAILGFSDQLYSVDMPNQQRDVVRMLLHSVNDLQILVDDLLEATKIETNQVRFHFVSFNPRELVDRVKSMFQKTCDEKKLTLVAEIDENIPQDLIGDPYHIQQIIVNLVNNSMKFTTQGFIKIKLMGTLYDTDYWHLHVSVEDTGKGMDERDQKKMQGFFSTTDSLQQDGTELGMSVCKNLIFRMGGSVHFKSELDKGTEFWFRISLKIAPIVT